MAEKTPSDYSFNVQHLASRAQTVADEIATLISTVDMARRGRHLAIARTQIELGVAMLLRAADM